MFKRNFTKDQIEKLRSLIEQRCSADRNTQKVIRTQMRGMGFYGEKCFGIKDMTIPKFNELISRGLITISDEQQVQHNEEANKVENNCKCFDALIDDDSEILVLGTMPGKDSLKSGEYYTNVRNCFWKIIRDVFNGGKDFKNYKEKCDCLEKNHIALWDVLATCEREGSSDENITDEVPNDIDGLLKQYHKIKKIVFNGQKPREKFKHEVACDYLCLDAPSTSGAYPMNYDEKLKAWKEILSPEKNNIDK